MPSTTPQELHEALDRSFRAGDLDAVMALYERDAAFLSAQDDWITGVDAIREATAQFLALKPDMRNEPPQVLESEDTAIIKANWTMTATAPGGSTIDMAGKSINVARRQSDGSWLLVFRSILPS